MYFEHNAAVGAARATSDRDGQHARRRGRARPGARRHAGGRASLYKAQLGSPKNKRLMKVLQEPGNKQLVQKMELDHIADRRLPAREAGISRHRGGPALRPRREGPLGPPHRPGRRRSCRRTSTDAFVLPDISQEVHRIDRDHDLSPEEKIESAAPDRDRLRVEGERLNIVHQLLRAHALYERDVNYVVQEARCSSSTSSPAAPCRAVAGPKDCTRRSRPRKACSVKGETQTSPRSRSRTTSACTTSWPA